MYTLRDVVSGNVTFLNEMDLIALEGIEKVSVIVEFEKPKIVKAHVGLETYLLGKTFKGLVREKVKKDLGSGFIFKFAI
jgi:hypothetical protein